jgi:hypothetical protein
MIAGWSTPSRSIGGTVAADRGPESVRSLI